MATVHLIAGLPCSGKTTYAVRLRDRTAGVLMSLDHWLIVLHGRYEIEAVGHHEHARRVIACREVMWEMGREFAGRGVDVILDDGYFWREHRMQRIRAVAESGARALIHYIDTPAALIRPRLEQRNADLPAYNFRIDPDAMDTFAAMFEVPGEDEGVDVVVVRDG